MLSADKRRAVSAQHQTPVHFTVGAAVDLKLNVPAGASAVLLHYRHVDQAENYQTVPMSGAGFGFQSSIPAAYTVTKFPLEYFFEIRSLGGDTVLFPGFAPDLTNQPYFVLRSV